MKNGILSLLLLVFPLTQMSCTTLSTPPFKKADCSGISPTSLTHYDQMSKEFLTESISHPSDNEWGAVVWATRYYLESLLTAYEATGNPKYIRSFLDSGVWVMNLAQTLTVLNVPDPTAPGKAGPLISIRGWPSQGADFRVPIAIPTQTGQIALFAQALNTLTDNQPAYFRVTLQGDGSLELAWLTSSNETLETHTVRNLADLNALASKTLIDDPSTTGESPGRIIPTGLGLPAPGKYVVGLVIQTIWHEQTGGILYLFIRFLLLAEEHPGLAEAEQLALWRSQVLAIAASYEDEFVPDGSGGLRFHNPIWLPNGIAGLDAASDYIYVEATMRTVLFELTRDPHQLSIARGLGIHQISHNLPVNSQGWLLLRFWPDAISWTSRTSAPSGSIWDSFEFDSTTSESPTDGGTFVDFLHVAKFYGLSPELGIGDSAYTAHQKVFQQYLRIDSVPPAFGSTGLMRFSYPTAASTTSDPVIPSQDPFVSSGYLVPELADQSFVNANWEWMLNHGKDPQGQSIGYFLRAWARSEAAELSVCQGKANLTQ